MEARCIDASVAVKTLLETGSPGALHPNGDAIERVDGAD